MIKRINPYAIYVRCDGAMDYDSKNTGGVGYFIEFPDTVELENIKESAGRYEGANIERMELEGLIIGMEGLLNIYKDNGERLTDISSIIFITDRYALNCEDRTNPYTIRNWRNNKKKMKKTPPEKLLMICCK